MNGPWECTHVTEFIEVDLPTSVLVIPLEHTLQTHVFGMKWAKGSAAAPYEPHDMHACSSAIDPNACPLALSHDPGLIEHHFITAAEGAPAYVCTRSSP